METIKSADGTTIAFDRVGQGPPVILVGGAFSWRRWKGSVELADLLSPHFSVLTTTGVAAAIAATRSRTRSSGSSRTCRR